MCVDTTNFNKIVIYQLHVYIAKGDNCRFDFKKPFLITAKFTEINWEKRARLVIFYKIQMYYDHDESKILLWTFRLWHYLSNIGIAYVLYYDSQEIQCLQDHLETLEVECQEVIGNFTEDEDEMPELDVILMKACTPMINKFCDTVCANQGGPGFIKNWNAT